MRLLHTEASNGWGGQEMRILKEAIGMREKGHEVFFATVEGGQLAQKAREAGFKTFELPFAKMDAPVTLAKLIQLIRTHKIDIINTHSSWDSWMGGIAARLSGTNVVRTRHLSTPIKEGLNSVFLYKYLADRVVTTCKATAEAIEAQADRIAADCQSIPTGVDILTIHDRERTLHNFRKEHDIGQDLFLVGTACILRSWKGLMTLVQAAKELKDEEDLKIVIIGDGPMRPHLENEARRLNIFHKMIFTGFLKDPLPAICALDIFALLSTAHEGVSQAVLQAAYLRKPLITTSTGGLPEVCINGKTGLIVPKDDPLAVSQAILKLKKDVEMRRNFGEAAHTIVEDHFTWDQTLNEMEKIFLRTIKVKKGSLE